MYEDVDAQAEEDDALELGVLVHDDGDDSDVGEEASGAAHDVFAAQPELAGRVQAPVVHAIVVALGQELDGAVLLFVELQHSVDDGDVASLHLTETEILNKFTTVP